MKFTKHLFLTLCVIAATTTAFAQKAQVYTWLSGGTTTMNTLTTNAFVVAGVTNQLGNPTSDTPSSSTTNWSYNMVQTVAEYNSFGLTWQFTAPTGSTNAAVTLFGYKSFDNGVTYESNPSIVYTMTPTALLVPLTWTTNLTVSCTDASHIAWSVENKTVGYITNVVLKVNLKSPKYGARSATQ